MRLDNACIAWARNSSSGVHVQMAEQLQIAFMRQRIVDPATLPESFHQTISDEPTPAQTSKLVQ